MKRLWTLGILLVLLLAGCGGGEPEPLHLTAPSGPYEATLDIVPAVVGANQYQVKVVDEAGRVIAGQAAVLHFSMPGMTHGKSEEVLKPGQDGIWQGDGPHLMMDGSWQVELEWRDDEGTTRRFAFTFELAENG